MTKEISTDAELISRLLSTHPTPAECLVAAARIEQLRDRLARMEGALQEWRHATDTLAVFERDYPGDSTKNWRNHRDRLERAENGLRAALTDGGSNG
jgi:hypothetical protein